MREILFRGKRLDNGTWVYGYYVGDCGDGISEIVDTSASCAPRVAIDPATVGQYTGLLDKNGKKIFEGDYVRTKYGRICEVVWHQPAACWDMNAVAKIDFKAPLYLECWRARNNEVIGNRWDNPELLEEVGGNAEL